MLQAQHRVAILLIYLVTPRQACAWPRCSIDRGLIPRWLAILGLIIYPTLLAGGFLDMFNLVDMTQGVGLAALVPGTLFELILPIWLIVKGATFPSDT